MTTGVERRFDVIAIATSAGGLRALSRLLGSLPRDLPAVILVVLHLDPRHPSLMADILRRRTEKEVKQATAGERVSAGTIYLAPPDQHLLISPNGILSLSHSEP